MFSQACVNNSVHRGRCTHTHTQRHTHTPRQTLDRRPPHHQADTPPGRTSSRADPPGQTSPQTDGCYSERYAYYWNSFLFSNIFSRKMLSVSLNTKFIFSHKKNSDENKKKVIQTRRHSSDD